MEISRASHFLTKLNLRGREHGVSRFYSERNGRNSDSREASKPEAPKAGALPRTAVTEARREGFTERTPGRSRPQQIERAGLVTLRDSRRTGALSQPMKDPE